MPFPRYTFAGTAGEARRAWLRVRRGCAQGIPSRASPVVPNSPRLALHHPLDLGQGLGGGHPGHPVSVGPCSRHSSQCTPRQHMRPNSPRLAAPPRSIVGTLALSPGLGGGAPRASGLRRPRSRHSSHARPAHALTPPRCTTSQKPSTCGAEPSEARPMSPAAKRASTRTATVLWAQHARRRPRARIRACAPPSPVASPPSAPPQHQPAPLG